MATAKKSGAEKSSSKTPSRASSSNKVSKSAGTKSRSRSSNTAHKTGHKTARGQAWTDKHSENESSTGHGKAKKSPAKQSTQCWPGYEPVAGKARGTKGSCKPKAHQSPSEKKADAMAASASRLRKAGGSKAKANNKK